MSQSTRRISVNELAQVIGGTVHGDGALILSGISPLETARPNELSFLTKHRYRQQAAVTHAGCVIVASEDALPAKTVIVTPDPHLAYVKAMHFFFPEQRLHLGISPDTSIDGTVELGTNVSIGSKVVVGARSSIGSGTAILAGVVIGDDCRVGSNCVIHPGAILYPQTELGNRVIVHANAVLGVDGFGFYLANVKPVRVPQVGRVVIEDEVEIGPCVCVERATFDQTRIGARVKIGALTYVGHNVSIGNDTVIVGQTGVSGSVKIGSGCRIWGQVGIRGHIEIGDGARILARSAVFRSVPPGSVYGGEPAVPHLEWKRIVSSMKRLPNLIRTIGRNALAEQKERK